MSEFVHLHLHTEFSLLDGACRIDELLDQAQKLKMPALAVTEHGNMFSSVVFHDAARKRGINPILGCEVYVAPGDRRDKSGTPGETANHLVLLAENEKGFKNLIKLVSSGYTEGFYYKPRIDKQLLAQHAEGLIGLSSCLKGEVATETVFREIIEQGQADGVFRAVDAQLTAALLKAMLQDWYLKRGKYRGRAIDVEAYCEFVVEVLERHLLAA